LKHYSKQLPDSELTATGTVNPPGIASTKRLVTILEENVALDLDEGINPSKSHLVRRKTISRRKMAVEEGPKMPTISR